MPFTLRHVRSALALVLAPALLSCTEKHTDPLRPPGPPGGVYAFGVVGGVRVAWEATAGATGYRVKRAAVTHGPYTTVATPALPSFVDPIGAGSTGFYVVSATNTAGESAESAEVSAAPAAAAPSLPAEDPARNHLGLNTWFLSDWDGSSAFVDVVKHARPWQDAADWHLPVSGVDALGWPTADASTVFWSGTPAEINGTYRLVFKGQADVALMWLPGAVANERYDAITNTTSADVTVALTQDGGGGLVLTNTRRTAASPLHSGFTELHLYRPGYPADGSVVFTTPYLDALGLTSVVRMMDWTATNGNLVRRWSERRTPLHMSRTGPGFPGQGWLDLADSDAGVALEHQIQLCNALRSDCWINIPVLADDDFVRKVALALRYGTDGTEPYRVAQAAPVYPPLAPDLRVYLEFANEIWNSAGGFLGFHVLHDLVRRLPADHALLTPAESNIYVVLWRYPAYRMAAISDVFREVYGDAAMMTRIRPLLMTQQGNSQATLSSALEWLDHFARRQVPGREVRSYLYGAGGSAYYNGNTWPMATPGDPAEFFAAANHPSTANLRGMGVDAVWAANFGLRRVAYEGGPSLDDLTEVQANALNLDPRMQDVIVSTHDAWSANGGDLLVYYTVTGPHEWAFTPDLAGTLSPKLAALDQLRGRPRATVTLGPALPGTLAAVRDDTRADAVIRTGYDWSATVGGQPCIAGNDVGEWVALTGHAGAAFSGSLTVSGSAGADATMAVWVNGLRKGEVTLPAGDGLHTSSALTADIPAGLVVIRLEPLTAAFTVCGVSAG